MTEAINQGRFEQLDPAVLVFSKSVAQAERRKHFDGPSLKELTDNVASTGILQPIVVRPLNGDGTYEVVAGERRVLAARRAKLDLVPAMVRELTDDQALDIQLIENLQREGLHEIVEAEGYYDLKERGHSIEQIAAKVGKSTSYVYKRLELMRCSAEVRNAFYEGKIDASKALLVSQLRSEKLQKQALKDITQPDYRGDLPSFREASRQVRERYMLRLDQASFKTEDATLVPAAGACGACPKNTAHQTGLFGDVSKAAVCTDHACFKSKVSAAAAIEVAAAKAAGQTILEGKKASKALQHGGGFQKLDAQCYDDSKYRTYEQLLGKDAPVTIAVDPESGRAVKLVNLSEARAAMKKRGVKLRPERSPSSAPKKKSAKQIEAESAAAAAEKFLVTVAKAIHSKVPKPFTTEELQKVAELVYGNTYSGPLDEVVGNSHPRFDKLNDSDLLRLIRSTLLSEHIAEDDKGVVLAAAKRHGVDAEKIRQELEPKKTAVVAAPAVSKKKAAKKK